MARREIRIPRIGGKMGVFFNGADLSIVLVIISVARNKILKAMIASVSTALVLPTAASNCKQNPMSTMKIVQHTAMAIGVELCTPVAGGNSPVNK